MSRIDALNQRYADAASLVRSGVEVVAVGDPNGARLNAALRRLLLVVRDDGPGFWDDLVGAAKALRWRSVTQPQPIELNPALRDGAEQVVLQVRRLRGAVSGANEALLHELAEAAEAVATSDPVLGSVLWRSVEEGDPGDCVVVAASKAAQAGLERWLAPLGVVVRTAIELERQQRQVEWAYVVGPPRFFRSALVTAPTTSAVTFVVPAWFADRSIPRSAIAAYADGAIRIEARISTEGNMSDLPLVVAVDEVEDDFLPQPAWGTSSAVDREPTSEEVVAHKLLLSGNLALWLDDGDRIRTLDPDQPSGERVTYTDVEAVRAGTYLLLRRGETERGTLYRAALRLMGARASNVGTSQQSWKELLSHRLAEQGYAAVRDALRRRGVKTANRVRAWTEPSLVRPQSDHDFEALIEWLGLPIQPTFGYATMLRGLLYQASADIRDHLEAAVGKADLSVLERDGNMSLDLKAEGFRGIIATRVLAISPHTEIVSRHDARVPFPDRSAQWLE
jgi:hypothetical protein